MARRVLLRLGMSLDLSAVFVPVVPIGETIFRGTLVYLALFLLFRFVMRRQAGAMAPADLMLVLLISEATQNGMARDVASVTDSLVLVATLASWDYALDWLAVRSVRFRKLVSPPPRLLVENGKALRRTMREELITMEELMTTLREQGIESLEDVKTARMESDGQVSVLKREVGEARPRREKSPGV